MADALTDPLTRWDPKSQELAYNNLTDRVKIELPSYGSAAASGIVSNPVDEAHFVGKYIDLETDSVQNVVWDPAPGKRYVITDFVLNAATVGTIKFYNELNIPENAIAQFALPSGTTVTHTFRKPYPGSAIDDRLMADCYAGCSGHLSVWGYEI